MVPLTLFLCTKLCRTARMASWTHRSTVNCFGLYLNVKYIGLAQFISKYRQFKAWCQSLRYHYTLKQNHLGMFYMCLSELSLALNKEGCD